MRALATGRVPAEQVGPLPGNVLAYSWIPQFELLRHADALLTHGGMNSVLEALTWGVPMVLRPRIREQAIPRTAPALEIFLREPLRSGRNLWISPARQSTACPRCDSSGSPVPQQD